MKIAILQPSYFPWPGYFHWILKCDTFVFYDDVQYDKDGWRNRNKIKCANGEMWLTVPVLTKGKFGQEINEVLIDNKQNWGKKHLESIRQNYKKSRYYDKYINFFIKLYSQQWEKLADLCVYTMLEVSRLIGIEKTFIRVSQLNIEKCDKIERLIKVCKKLNGTEYITGIGFNRYYMGNTFEQNQIKLTYTDYHCNKYPQLWNTFIPNLSIIDLLFNCGEECINYLDNKHPSVA